VTVYTDSHYTFGTIHVHGAIYRESGFITAEGKELHNLSEIQRQLLVVQKPQAVAVVHVPGHQSAQTLEAKGTSEQMKWPEMLLWPPQP
jgi:ribonuclease HI